MELLSVQRMGNERERRLWQWGDAENELCVIEAGCLWEASVGTRWLFGVRVV